MERIATKKYHRLLLACFLLFAGLCLSWPGTLEAKAAVKISKSSMKVAQGVKKQLRVKGTSARVTWSSNKPKVVTVDEDGVFTAVKGGKAIITATVGNTTLRCKVMVVGLNATSLTMQKDGIFALKTKNGSNTRWASSDKSVVTVTAKGVVKAKNSGTAVITCTTNGRKIRCKVYVVSILNTSFKMAVDTTYNFSSMVLNYGEACVWTSSNPSVAAVDSEGVITAISAGKTTITCTLGTVSLSCELTVSNPSNITTPMSALPASSREDKLDVTVESYLSSRTYTVYKQSADVNKITDASAGIKGYTKFMPNHGCAACALTTVLSGYADLHFGPAYTVTGIEKNLLGSDWSENYTKASDNQRPISMYGITRVLNHYGIANRYVRNFTDAQALNEITQHLLTGNAVIIEAKNKNRSTGATDTTWSNSYHTMVLLGMTDDGRAIVADSADRSDATFGNNKRVKYATVLSLLPYMYPSSSTTTSAYFNGEGSSAGYILVNPQG